MIKSAIIPFVFGAALFQAFGQTLYVSPDQQSALETIKTSTFGSVGRSLVGTGASAIAQAPDGTSVYIATANDVRQFNVQTGALVATYPIGSATVALAVSPDGSKLYALTDTGGFSVLLFDTATGDELAAVTIGQSAAALALSPDGQEVYVAGTVDLYRFDALTLRQTAESTLIAAALTFGPSASTLYASIGVLSFAERSYGVWEIDTTSLLVNKTIDTSGKVTGLAASADGTKIYAAGDAGLLEISTASNQIVKVIDPQAFTSVVLAPDGQNVFCVQPFKEGSKESLFKFDLASGSYESASVEGAAAGISLSPDGGALYLLLKSTLNVDYISEATNHIEGAVSSDTGNYVLASSLDGEHVATTYSKTGNFTVIDTSTHEAMKGFSYAPSSGPGLGLSKDGTYAFFPAGSPAYLEVFFVPGSQGYSVQIPNSSGADMQIAASPDNVTVFVRAPQLCAVDYIKRLLNRCGPKLTEAYTGLFRTLAVDSTGASVYAIESSSLNEYDSKSLDLLESITLPNSASAVGLVFSGLSNSIYVIGFDPATSGGEVFRIDSASFTLQAAGTVDGGMPHDVAVSQDGTEVYVVQGSGEVAILNATTLTAEGELPNIRALSIVSAAH